MLLISVSGFLLNKTILKGWSDFFFLPTIQFCLLSPYKCWQSVRVLLLEIYSYKNYETYFVYLQNVLYFFSPTS